MVGVELRDRIDRFDVDRQSQTAVRQRVAQPKVIDIFVFKHHAVVIAIHGREVERSQTRPQIGDLRGFEVIIVVLIGPLEEGAVATRSRDTSRGLRGSQFQRDRGEPQERPPGCRGLDGKVSVNRCGKRARHPNTRLFE